MLESFVAGFAYGATTVVVGQPLDTIKTLQQASQQPKSVIALGKELWASGGIVSFYRGGFPMLLGGGLMRSAQFGFYNVSLRFIRKAQGPVDEQSRILGIFDPQVILAGLCGGFGRGLVEAPFELIKVRQQVQQPWHLRDGILSGFGTTLVRNSFLFSSFAVYMDLLQHKLHLDLGAFLTGGICANLAWLTIWPLDVVKSRVQSGRYAHQSAQDVLVAVARSGELYKGLAPGLVRSFIANGSSMVVYRHVERTLLAWNHQ